VQLHDVSQPNGPGLHDACSPSTVAEHRCKASAPEGFLHAGAGMTTPGHLEQCLPDFQDGATGDLEIESANAQVSSRLTELDGTAQQILDDRQVFVLKQRRRTLARTAVIGVGLQIPGVDLNGRRKPPRPHLDDLHAPTRHRLFDADSCKPRKPVSALRHVPSVVASDNDVFRARAVGLARALETATGLWFLRRMHNLTTQRRHRRSARSFLVGGPAIALLLVASCGSSDSESVCGSERPCVPEGTWVVTYDNTPSGVSFSPNTIRIDSDGSAEVVAETVPDNEGCEPGEPTPGDLTTSAELSDDGCTLTATIDKDYCASGEENCDYRTVTLLFCNDGNATTATGSLHVCICWSTGTPFCGDEDDFVTTAAAAVRAP
jgi:hypothetical protein